MQYCNNEDRVRAGLRIPPDLNRWLADYAKSQGLSKNSLILQILWRWKGKTEEAARQMEESRLNG